MADYCDFYSSIKQANTLEPGDNEELSEDEVTLIGRSPSKPNPLNAVEKKNVIVGEARYNSAKDMFQSNNWSMREYLIWYNNLDVAPFLKALQNLSDYYSDRKVDAFKDGVSVPGIAERIAFNTLKSDEVFFLFNRSNSDLVHLFRDNLVGGPAIIFNRYQEAGVTKIRHNPDGKMCV